MGMGGPPYGDQDPNNPFGVPSSPPGFWVSFLRVVRIETDPADRTQLRITVASGDPALTYELKEFIKEQLISIPTASQAPPPVPQQAPPTRSPIAPSDPGAMLAGLL